MIDIDGLKIMKAFGYYDRHEDESISKYLNRLNDGDLNDLVRLYEHFDGVNLYTIKDFLKMKEEEKEEAKEQQAKENALIQAQVNAVLDKRRDYEGLGMGLRKKSRKRKSKSKKSRKRKRKSKKSRKRKSKSKKSRNPKK